MEFQFHLNFSCTFRAGKQLKIRQSKQQRFHEEGLLPAISPQIPGDVARGGQGYLMVADIQPQRRQLAGVDIQKINCGLTIGDARHGGDVGPSGSDLGGFAGRSKNQLIGGFGPQHDVKHQQPRKR